MGARAEQNAPSEQTPPSEEAAFRASTPVDAEKGPRPRSPFQRAPLPRSYPFPAPPRTSPPALEGTLPARPQDPPAKAPATGVAKRRLSPVPKAPALFFASMHHGACPLRPPQAPLCPKICRVMARLERASANRRPVIRRAFASRPLVAHRTVPWRPAPALGDLPHARRRDGAPLQPPTGRSGTGEGQSVHLWANLLLLSISMHGVLHGKSSRCSRARLAAELALDPAV